ncbi:protein NLP3 isoform X2 [Gossypium raimondii]|uniref:protein NLP3 isoform X2 n=2 Tax=Gossypium raimondii TaxID=29730 RepID=UPI00227CCCFD|nr:protein NLP3 isoform X2 [Gossypium raimondii]
MADFFSLPLDDAASTLGVCTSVLKKICRENGLDRWLHCKPDAGLAAAILMQNLSRISMAATAYSKGELEYAAYLSDQEKIQTKLAREADEGASQSIFKARLVLV